MIPKSGFIPLNEVILFDKKKVKKKNEWSDHVSTAHLL